MANCDQQKKTFDETAISDVWVSMAIRYLDPDLDHKTSGRNTIGPVVAAILSALLLYCLTRVF